MRLPIYILVCAQICAAQVRSPSEASGVLESLLHRTEEAPAAARPIEPAAREGGAVFVSDVRLVNLHVSVADRGGRPVSGMKPGEFEVLEDGVRQEVSVASAEEVPFSLVLLLDLSGSTLRDRAAMREAARGFIRAARSQDRLSVCALASGEFRVISPLTDDHARLLRLMDEIPDLSGDSPLYASIALAWNEELARHPQERNAVIVVSDGIDDSLEQKATPVSFDRLRRAVPAMPALIYPIYLDSRNIFYGARAERQMRELAKASGGRLFVARTLAGLAPVYAEVAEELRSVYTLAYYPKKQNFDGRWRRLQVRVSRPDLRLRARTGYYAR